jgi:predicted nuclease of restriction endonuclease-like (RecB) superfamily
LLAVYWETGKILLEQKEREGWGKKIIEVLAKDLKEAFPNMKGFSQRNLEYMQTFAAAWPYFPFPQPPAAKLEMTGQIDNASIPQSLTAELQSVEKHVHRAGQPLLSLIPWTHHTIILDKANTEEERMFYITKVLANGWSSRSLQVHIETALFQREGKAITNFDKRLPADQAELAMLTLKVLTCWISWT